MGKYIKLFENHAQYTAYTASTEFITPNVSHCKEEVEVHYNPWVAETRLVAVLNVNNTSYPTPLMYHNKENEFTEIEIDGVVQPSVVSAYTFDTIGEHTVKYTLADPTSIGRDTFASGFSFTSIVIPNSVTSIGSSAFFACTNLTSINIPSGVTSIGENAFNDCSLSSINIPSGVTSIGLSAFSGCRGLTSCTFEENSQLTSIGGGAFASCISLTSIDIPNSVTSISGSAFAACSGLTSIDIPSGVTIIDYSVFYNCYALTSVNMPSGVTSIGSNAFYNCSGLTSIDIPSGVTSIGEWAFASCSSLTSVTSNAMTAPTIQNSTFQSVKTNGTLYVPQGSSGYNTWMGTGNHYLGKYGWTKVEQ